jgi:UDP-N-acetylmuramate dehydrogenase
VAGGGGVTDELDDLLIGDEAIGTGDGAVANPRSMLDLATRAALRSALGDDVQFDEPMRRHTTAKIGGPADAFARPSTIAAVEATIRAAREHGLPLTVVGGGSNLLIYDAGIRGLVLNTARLRSIELTAPTTITVSAGTPTSKVLQLALTHDLGGVEFLGGVPGSVGGGLIMNAGTYLGEFTNVVTSVTSVSLHDGAQIERDHDACGFRYRGSDLPPTEIVVGATLTLRPRPRAESDAEIKALRLRRSQREPKKVASNGSTFKNPPGDFAGRLIESAGCKGWQVGDALCSPVHGNWLVNVGAATCADMLTLIERVRARVRAVHAIELVLEVKVTGDAIR